MTSMYIIIDIITLAVLLLFCVDLGQENLKNQDNRRGANDHSTPKTTETNNQIHIKKIYNCAFQVCGICIVQTFFKHRLLFV